MTDPTIPGSTAATPPGGASEPAAGGPSGAPGVESHVAGQDTSQATAAGAAPGGTGLDSGTGPYAPSEDVLASSGDSVGDDDVIPEEGLPGDGESITGTTSSVTSTSTSEPPD